MAVTSRPAPGLGPGVGVLLQIGMTLVLRWQPSDERRFLEAGIGANVLLPVYRSREKRFRTAFNFGDHVGIGTRSCNCAIHGPVRAVAHHRLRGVPEQGRPVPRAACLLGATGAISPSA